MATNHTTNYALNLWEPTDAFLREEFNENTQKIDAAIKAEADARAALAQTVTTKVSIVTGTYEGVYDNKTNPSQSIYLGFQPKVLFVWSPYTSRYIEAVGAYQAVAAENYPFISHFGTTVKVLEITSTGFTVNCTSSNGDQYYPHLNEGGRKYYYIAFR